MALGAQEAAGNTEITVPADRDYFNGDQVLACGNPGVLPCLPKSPTSGNAKRSLFNRPGLHLRCREVSLYLPCRRASDDGACPIGAPRRRRPIQPSDRLLHLSPKAQVYAGQVKADQAEEHERVLDVMQAGLDYLPDAIGGAPANCRVSSRNLQIVGREYALPDQDAKLGPHRDEPPGSGLHHEAGDRSLVSDR
jgi:hypothetical protein